MCSWSSRRNGSVSARNAASSPARACARVCSVTLASSQRRWISHASHVMTSGRSQTRRSVSVAASASTPNTGEGNAEMARIVMSGPQNMSLDGVVQDPDGQEGFGLGGWFVEFGGEDLKEWHQL